MSRSNKLAPEANRILFVKNLAYNIDAPALFDLFGKFGPIRQIRAGTSNTTKGTAHRRFAVTINLNTGEYNGGVLRFPEFGQQCYEAPLGGAVVFSCSLMHEATPVTRGRRYAFLPFLYDEPAAQLREKNQRFVNVADEA